MIEHGEGVLPEILADSELCEAYHWTWDELQATPLYVRRMFALIQQMKRAKAANDSDDANTQAKHPGAVVVRHG